MFTNENKYIYVSPYESFCLYNRNEKIYDKEYSFSSQRLMNKNKNIYICKYDKTSENRHLTLINKKIHLTNNYDASNKKYTRNNKRK